MKKVFLTGAGGFIGKYLTKYLIKNGYEVHGLFTDSEMAKKKRVNPKLKVYCSNLLEYEEMGMILKNVDPDFIIHLAARTEVEKSFYDPISFSEINYCGTVNLIEKARELKNLKLFLFSSTMETYGWSPESDFVKRDDTKNLRPFTEHTAQHPNAPYAVAKLGCEKYLEYVGRSFDFPFCALRQTNTYGRWDNDFFVVEQIITQMLKLKKKDEPNEINLGYDKPYRNLLFIDDLIDLYGVVLKNYEKASGEMFCTGPDNALSIKDLVDKIASKLRWTGKVNWNKKPARPGEIYYLNSSHAKVERVLGWSPKTGLNEGLDKAIKIWKDNLKKTNELAYRYR